MPYGNAAELDALWRAAKRDEIMALLVPFCALCDGAGMSFRTIRKHPHVHWERYQLAGLRISSDWDFNTDLDISLRPCHSRAAPDRP